MSQARSELQDLREQVARLAFARDSALFQDYDVVGTCTSEGCVVRRDHYGSSLRGQLAECPCQVIPPRRIERRRRFIHEQHRWIDSQRPGNCDALRLASGQLVR